MVRALGRRGIPVAVATAESGSSLIRSRYCHTVVRTPSFVDDPEGAVGQLVAWARKQQNQPVLFYQGDHDLLALSRLRDRLSPHFHCVLPPAELVEDLVDKLRFAALAQRLSLPVPPTLTLRREAGGVEARGWSHFPCVLKPAVRTRWFGSKLQQRATASTQKAVRVENRSELELLLPLIEAHETDFVLQAAVEGGEERILSYHAYVRPGGELVAEFTGKKLRTAPRRYGVSTYVEITDDREVKRLGRWVIERLAFSGVLKMDWKQDERDGRLYLLEINPRFSLWHHLATVGGLCLPELVYRDCLEPGSAKAEALHTGVRWLSLHGDRRAFREHCVAGELSVARWLWQLMTADVNEDFALSDPMPGLVDLIGIAKRKLARVLGGAARRSPGVAET
jgi:predicted ATP-grasp superfamily ATP-dependent carboligase